MELPEFTGLFASVFDETDPSTIHPKTEFKNLDEWSSLVALSVIAFVDEKLSVTITGTDIQEANTVEDLFLKIKQRLVK